MHKAGYPERKQNVFDDFIAVGEYLIREKYTSPAARHQGRIERRLLVGAVMTQRARPVRVAVPQVGVMDMLRYDRIHRRQAWATEYGTHPTRSSSSINSYSRRCTTSRARSRHPAPTRHHRRPDDRVVPSHSTNIVRYRRRRDAISPWFVSETQGSHGYRPTDRLIAERLIRGRLRLRTLAFARRRPG